MREHTVRAITDLILAAEPTVPADAIYDAVDSVMTRQPAALRLLQELDADHGMLVDGDARMPKALERIVTLLVAAGATTVRLPRCGGCGETRPLGGPGPLRLCERCRSKQRAVELECNRCGRFSALHISVAGRVICRACWEGGRAGSTALLEARLRTGFPGIDVAAALPRHEADSQRLLAELDAFGEQWFRDPAPATSHFARLHESLRRAGADLPPLVCGHCRNPGKRVVNRLEGLHSCGRCYKNARWRECSGCGELAEIARRQPDGAGLCARCTKLLDDERTECARCGIHRIIAIRTTEGPLCGTCRAQEQIDRCRTCQREAPCRFAGTERAICESCAAPRVPCSSCERVRLVAKRSPTGMPLCAGCHERPGRPCTDCGRVMEVRGLIDSQPYCGTCYTHNPGSHRPCVRCAALGRLDSLERCPRCKADDLVAELIPDSTADADARYALMRAAILASPPERVLGAFLRKSAVQTLASALAIPGGPSHEALDAYGPEQKTRTTRALLVEHGILPARDEYIARLERWIDEQASCIHGTIERKAFTQFARWKHLNQLRRSSTPTTYGAITARRRELRLILDLLQWGHERGRSLATLTQGDIELWVATQKEAAQKVKIFLRWTRQNGLSRPLQIHRVYQRRLTVVGTSDEERWAALERALDDGVAPGTALAAGLLLLYGIRTSRIVALRVSDIEIRDGAAFARIGKLPLRLRPELAEAAAATVQQRQAARMLTDTIESEWLFPGPLPGRPLSVDTLRKHLRDIGISPSAARRGAVASLAQQINSPVILARLTGMHPSSAAIWSDAVSASSGNYAALRAASGPLQSSSLSGGDTVDT